MLNDKNDLIIYYWNIHYLIHIILNMEKKEKYKISLISFYIKFHNYFLIIF